ncbi:glutathione S-transferase [Enhydrobacter aerosaccus]|uniref:glutathione transferase n=1 Tax=Enhydrobacter aerosaccus TaxID=225324 RepID=A0A1T4T5C6_9HYPH|nr:glutathione S-transferase [Enhydrobacter aerosaccus]SKA35714.1 glutathione S-transferase [Enhydrobacter aerosaccus]
MIVVHHLNNSRSQRILWMLEELGIPYEVKRYERDAATMLAPASLRAVHPLGKSPVISDGDLVLAESGAILEYLADTYGGGKFAPAPGTPDRLRYSYFMHYAEGSLMPPLLMKLVFSRIPQRVPFFLRPAAKAIAAGVEKNLLGPQLRNHLSFLESELSKRDWFAGDSFSAADVQMSFPLEGASARTGLGADYPRLAAFLDRIHARPAYKKAIERGGPYALLK